LADIAIRPPANGMVEVAGPETFRLDEPSRLVVHPSMWHTISPLRVQSPTRGLPGACRASVLAVAVSVLSVMLVAGPPKDLQ
jgi:hypothetical protein